MNHLRMSSSSSYFQYPFSSLDPHLPFLIHLPLEFHPPSQLTQRLHCNSFPFLEITSYSISSVDSANKSNRTASTDNPSTEAAPYLSLQTTHTTSVDNQSTAKPDARPSNDQQRTMGPGGQKRPRMETNSQQASLIFDSSASSSQQQNNDKKTTQGGRCRLFIGNIPSDLTQEEFQILFGKYGELIEYFVNPSRGFGFVKLVDLNHLLHQSLSSFSSRVHVNWLNRQNLILTVIFYVVNLFVFVLPVKVQRLK